MVWKEEKGSLESKRGQFDDFRELVIVPNLRVMVRTVGRIAGDALAHWIGGARHADLVEGALSGQESVLPGGEGVDRFGGSRLALRA